MQRMVEAAGHFACTCILTERLAQRLVFERSPNPRLATLDIDATSMVEAKHGGRGGSKQNMPQILDYVNQKAEEHELKNQFKQIDKKLEITEGADIDTAKEAGRPGWRV